MNQFEGDTLRIAIGLFVLFCIVFGFLRNRFTLWISVSRIVIVSCLGWLASAVVVTITARTSMLQGPVFMFAYFVVVLASAPLLAAGMSEVVLGTYASLMTDDRNKDLRPRSHFIAALMTFACVGVYCVAREI